MVLLFVAAVVSLAALRIVLLYPFNDAELPKVALAPEGVSVPQKMGF